MKYFWTNVNDRKINCYSGTAIEELPGSHWVAGLIHLILEIADRHGRMIPVVMSPAMYKNITSVMSKEHKELFDLKLKVIVYGSQPINLIKVGVDEIELIENKKAKPEEILLEEEPPEIKPEEIAKTTKKPRGRPKKE